jgi:hypothetical protein
MWIAIQQAMPARPGGVRMCHGFLLETELPNAHPTKPAIEPDASLCTARGRHGDRKRLGGTLVEGNSEYIPQNTQYNVVTNPNS